jgi:hypothetical protein
MLNMSGYTAVMDAVIPIVQFIGRIMAYRLGFEEYFDLLGAAIPANYKTGMWHPEDIATAVEFANTAVSQVLSNIPQNGVQDK